MTESTQDVRFPAAILLACLSTTAVEPLRQPTSARPTDIAVIDQPSEISHWTESVQLTAPAALASFPELHFGENWLTVQSPMPVAYEPLRELLSASADLSFEDGESAELIDQFVELVETEHEAAVNALARLIRRGLANDEALGRCFRWLGRCNSPQTSEQRRLLLEEQLSSKSVYLRDGAILGLASLADRRSIVALEKHVRGEKSPAIRAEMQQTIEYLKGC